MDFTFLLKMTIKYTLIHLAYFKLAFVILIIIQESVIKCLALSRHTVAAIPGDLVLGALFPVHYAPGPKQASSRTCGPIREQYGIQRVEAAFQTIDLINKNKHLLPNITLGIEIRDSCWYSPIALEQSIEFIRDAMAASDEKAKEEEKNQELSKSNVGMHPSSAGISHSPLFPLLNTPFDIQSKFNSTHFCARPIKKVKNLVGVIGPASSSVTIQVQNLLQLFNIPQIGYSATSKDLSLKNHYMYFLRVVPSDELQARVMVDLILANNWTYISALYTDGNYGSSLMEVFKGIAQDAGICIANTETVTNNAEDSIFDETVRSLQKYKSAKVVACFCEGLTVRGLLKAIRRLNATGALLLIGSDGWSDRYDVVEGYEVEAVGGISVRIHSSYVKEFDPYYFSLHPDSNTRNPWFKEFWENKFNCSFNKDKNLPKNFNNTCTGKESLEEKYKQDSKLSYVIKAIWTMAYGLHNMQKSLCPNVTGSCPAMLPVNGSIFLNYLLNVSFIWHNETLYFNKSGDPPGRYDIMNFQKSADNKYDYFHVGSWDSSSNQLHTWSPFQWPTGIVNSSDQVPESICSKPCQKGHAKNIQNDGLKCCWVCVPCQKNQFLRDEFTCEDCKLGSWPNENQTGCYQIKIEYIHWTDTQSLFAMSISILGFSMTFFCMSVFIKHNNTPVVKASTRELSYMIMIGMFLCYATTFALLAKPTKPTCFITTVLPGFSFAVIYGSLVTKTNRVARILAGSKKRIMTKKLRFMSSTAQVVITLLLVLIECGIIATMLIREPADSKLHYPALDKVILICNTTSIGIIAPLGFDFFLIAMCTVYAIKTRNVPENFNEAKFIGFTMYTTLVIWIAFIPIYFGSNLKVLTMSVCISFSAIVALVLLFFPKLYIIIFKPEKNNRSYFTTAKNVRCHIGYVPTLGISRHSSHSTSEFSVDSPRNHSLEVKHHFNQPMKRKAHHSSSLLPEKSVPASGLPRSDVKKPSYNIFERLRIKKQDKIAANVQEKIRAVRAAEALDRQTNRRGVNLGGVPPRQGSSSEFEPNDPNDTQKMKLISMLKQAFGQDVSKIPGFLEFIESLKKVNNKVLKDNSVQTSHDLVEAMMPSLRHRTSVSSNVNKDVEDYKLDNKSDLCYSNRVSSGDRQWHYQKDSPSNYQWFSTTYSSLMSSANNPADSGFDARSILKDSNYKKITPFKLESNIDPVDKYDKYTLSSKADHQNTSNGNANYEGVSTNGASKGTQTPIARRKHNSISSTSAKFRTSAESLLSQTGSCVIEESISSGAESSPGSGIVYKNIIISLSGNLINEDAQSNSKSNNRVEKGREYIK